jgi:hypothetical protein
VYHWCRCYNCRPRLTAAGGSSCHQQQRRHGKMPPSPYILAAAVPTAGTVDATPPTPSTPRTSAHKPRAIFSMPWGTLSAAETGAVRRSLHCLDTLGTLRPANLVLSTTVWMCVRHSLGSLGRSDAVARVGGRGWGRAVLASGRRRGVRHRPFRGHQRGAGSELFASEGMDGGSAETGVARGSAKAAACGWRRVAKSSNGRIN